jgi:Phosphate transporter family
VAVALLFDFLNGLHDAANSIATIVSTRVLRPQYAVFWAAFFNFIAFLFFGLHVADTIGRGIVDASVIDPAVIFGAGVRVRLALLARARRQRRSEDHGHHRRAALLAGSAGGRVPRAVLGRSHLPSSHGVLSTTKGVVRRRSLPAAAAIAALAYLVATALA